MLYLVVHVWFPDRCGNEPSVADVASLLLMVVLFNSAASDRGTQNQCDSKRLLSPWSLPCAEPAQSSSDEYPSSPKFRATVEEEVGGLFVFV